MQASMRDFLQRHGMHYDSIDMDAERKRLVAAMRDGLAGRPSSLLMIPAFVLADREIEAGREVLVLDAGGTNFRVATAQKQANGGIAIANFQKYPMPGTRGQITIDEFFEAVADYIAPVLEKTGVDTAGFCFSYVADILPSREGRLVAFSKEVDVAGAGGQLIGEGINRALQKRGQRTLRFTLLNDTVATMLSGMLGAEKDYSSYIGYILGTGTNTCYLEACANITKNPAAAQMQGHMAINMESGVYTGFALGAFDAELDRESQNPGDHLMEKMMGGVYQGRVIYKTVQRAVQEGYFTPEFAARFAVWDTFTMLQIDRFCAEAGEENELAALCGGNKADFAALYEIIDTSFERASRLAAILFAAIIQQTGAEASAARPVCITAEGTSFTKAVLFRPKLDRYMKDYLLGRLGYHCEIVSFADATLTGSACAALL